MWSGEVTVLNYSSTVVSREKMIMSPWDHEYHHVSMCEWHIPKVWWQASVCTESSILRKNGKSKMWFQGEKKLKLLCTYFSVGRYSTKCCYYSLYTLFEGGGWTTWNTPKKMISQRRWLSKATTQYVHDSKIRVEQIKEPCFLSSIPCKSLFCIFGLPYQELTMQNAFHTLPIAWLCRGRCPWENQLSAGVCISKSFLIFFPCSHWPVEQSS